jgi:sugar phosphate isomerase/epimerase
VDIGCSVSLHEIPLAQQAGFDFLELQVGTLLPELDDSHFQKIWDIVTKGSLPVKSFNAFLPPHIQIVGTQVNREKNERYVLTALRRMKELGGERVSFGSGSSRSCPPSFPKEKAREQIVWFIEFTAKAAKNYGIQVNIESLNRTECNMINSLLESKNYVEEINLPNVSLLADFYHMQMENEPLDHLIQVKNMLNYVHVADSGRLYPGGGTFPFRALAEILREIGYQGPISVECTWQDAEKELPQAALFLKSELGIR